LNLTESTHYPWIHKWGADAEEVTFEDLINDIGKDKVGYEKFRFMGSRLDEVACSTPGSILVASSTQTTPNLAGHQLSIPLAL